MPQHSHLRRLVARLGGFPGMTYPILTVLRALALALAFTACSTEPIPIGAGIGYCRDLSQPVRVIIDTRWTDAQTETVIAALDAWTDVAGVQWDVSTQECAVFDWVEDCITEGWDSPAKAGLDAVPDVPGVVVYTQDLGDVPLFTVLVHEIGHFLGAGHANYGPMAPYPETGPIPSGYLESECGEPRSTDTGWVKS